MKDVRITSSKSVFPIGIPGKYNQRVSMPGSFGATRMPGRLRIEDGSVNGKVRVSNGL